MLLWAANKEHPGNAPFSILMASSGPIVISYTDIFGGGVSAIAASPQTFLHKEAQAPRLCGMPAQ